MNGSPIGTPGTRIPRRVDQDEAIQPVGVAHRQLGREPAAQRQTDDVDTVQLERVQHVQRVEHQVLDRLDRIEALGRAESRVNREEDPAARGQEVVDRHPPEGAGAVEIEEGPAAAGLEQLDAAPVDAERALALRRGRDLGHRVPSPLRQVGRPREARAHQKGVAGETPSRIMRDLSSWWCAYHSTARWALEAGRRRRPEVRPRLYCARAETRAGGISEPGAGPRHVRIAMEEPCSSPRPSSAATRSPTG